MEGSSKKCEDLRKVEEDVVAFGYRKFLTDLGLTLVDRLKTLASEHIDLLVEKFALSKQHTLSLLH